MKKEIPWNLIIQKLKHDITAEEEHDLTVWLAEDNHRVIFEELQTLWQKVQENAINYTPDTNYYWKELSKRMKTTEVKAIVLPNIRQVVEHWLLRHPERAA